MNAIFPHRKVIVNYLYKWADRFDVPIENLQNEANLAATPRYMTIELPRCADCGAALAWKELKHRISPDGDLFDARFIWAGIKPKWMFWRSGYHFR
ncbi:MAG TPA: hypothetical protein VGB45_03600 [Abditibacterium sp.]|jgi:hypothetical protein